MTSLSCRCGARTVCSMPLSAIRRMASALGQRRLDEKGKSHLWTSARTTSPISHPNCSTAWQVREGRGERREEGNMDKEGNGEGGEDMRNVLTSPSEMISDLMGLVARLLVLGGRFVFWLPADDTFVESDLVPHPCLRLVSMRYVHTLIHITIFTWALLFTSHYSLVHIPMPPSYLHPQHNTQ